MPKTYGNIKVVSFDCRADTGFRFKSLDGQRSKKHVAKFQANCVTIFYVIEFLIQIVKSILSLNSKQFPPKFYSNSFSIADITCQFL